MTYQTLVEYNSPDPDPRVQVGIKLKKECPVRVLEMPVKYRVYEYKENGKKAKATWEEGQVIDGVKRIVKHTNKQPWQDHLHVYTVQRRYRYQDGFSEGPRFLTMPESVAQQLAHEYRDHISVRRVPEATREAFYSADEIEPREGSNENPSRHRASVDPLDPNPTPTARPAPNLRPKAGPKVEEPKTKFIQKDGRTVLEDKEETKEVKSLSEAISVAKQDGEGEPSESPPPETESPDEGDGSDLAEAVEEAEGGEED